MASVSQKRDLNTTTSVIIPSCNRQRLFPRIGKLWRDSGVRVIIVDGSISPSHYFEGLGLDMYQYIHLPFTGPFERIYAGISIARTEYTVVCGDDEYILPSALLEAVERLNCSSSTRFIQPRFIGFEWVKGVGSRYRKIYTEQESRWEEPEDRAMRIASNILRMSPTHIYAVADRAIHLEMFKAASYVGNIPVRGLQETIAEIIGSYYGRYIVTEGYGYLRSFEDSSIHALGGKVESPINLTHSDDSGSNYLPVKNRYLKSLARSIALMAENSICERTRQMQTLEDSLLIGFTALAYGWKLFNRYTTETALKQQIYEFSQEPFAKRFRIDTNSLYYWCKDREIALETKSFNINPLGEINSKELDGFVSCIKDYYLGA